MIAHKKALAKVLDKQWLDLTTPMGKGLLAFLSTPAEDELLRMTRRANEGREGASHFPVASQRARNSKRTLMLIAAFHTLGSQLPFTVSHKIVGYRVTVSTHTDRHA